MTPENVFASSDYQFDDKDGLLVRSYASAIVADVEPPITVLVKGVVVSGVMISPRRYYSQYVSEKAAETTRAHFAGIGESLTKEIQRLFKQDSLKLVNSIHVIYLGEAQIITATAAFPQPGLVFRIRVSEVDGFAFARLTVSNA